MSIHKIYFKLVSAGMTPESACGMMGNMQAESGLQANNVQNGMGYNDADYTAAVDAGAIDFVSDRRGYGLCQWTHPARKLNLLNFARSRGDSIGNENMQVDFCIHELKTEYSALWQWLCENHGVYPAADRICREYERPAVNNVDKRSGFANEFFMALGDMAVPNSGTAGETDTPSDVEEAPPVSSADSIPGDVVYWPPRVLAFGMYGPDVAALQGLLIAHGYPAGITGSFDKATDGQFRAWQSAHGLKSDGIAGGKSWAALCQR